MKYSPAASAAGTGAPSAACGEGVKREHALVVVYESVFITSPVPQVPLPTVPEMSPRSEILRRLSVRARLAEVKRRT